MTTSFERTDGGATAELLRALNDDLTTLARSKMRRAQEELAAEVRQAGFAATLYGVGAVPLGVAGWNEIHRSLESAPVGLLSVVRKDVEAVREGASGDSLAS